MVYKTGKYYNALCLHNFLDMVLCADSSQNPAAGADVCRLLILLAGTITKFEFLFSAPLDDQHPGLVLVLKSLDYLQQIAYADATKQHPSIATALCQARIQVFSAMLIGCRKDYSRWMQIFFAYLHTMLVSLVLQTVEGIRSGIEAFFRQC